LSVFAFGKNANLSDRFETIDNKLAARAEAEAMHPARK
jgi:hypothetical protein